MTLNEMEIRFLYYKYIVQNNYVLFKYAVDGSLFAESVYLIKYTFYTYNIIVSLTVIVKIKY